MKVDDNPIRRARGDRAIALHPDFDFKPLTFPSSDDYETAASDMVADILHAVFWSSRPHLSPVEFLSRALRTYEGDCFDEAAQSREASRRGAELEEEER